MTFKPALTAVMLCVLAACSPQKNWVASPLHEPLVDDQVVLRIASEVALAAVERCHSNEAELLQRFTNYFTRPALGQFQRELLQADYCDWYRTDSKLTAIPQMTDELIIDGARVWRVRVPVEATYSSHKERFDRHYSVDLELRRTNDLNVRRGVTVTSVRASRDG